MKLMSYCFLYWFSFAFRCRRWKNQKNLCILKNRYVWRCGKLHELLRKYQEQVSQKMNKTQIKRSETERKISSNAEVEKTWQLNPSIFHYQGNESPPIEIIALYSRPLHFVHATMKNRSIMGACRMISLRLSTTFLPAETISGLQAVRFEESCF